ncbi:hypothetical protein OIU74_002768 [Salix koriyanagi]|uniref:Secreted protein n=1 Tax=Salix koriyanagi TaxID=2511006 RepID=A0A9Q0X4W7_9ROSI|nr:hypothetical protein OIU74_002768 [Salix koriyanagi]
MFLPLESVFLLLLQRGGWTTLPKVRAALVDNRGTISVQGCLRSTIVDDPRRLSALASRCWLEAGAKQAGSGDRLVAGGSREEAGRQKERRK